MRGDPSHSPIEGGSELGVGAWGRSLGSELGFGAWGRSLGERLFVNQILNFSLYPRALPLTLPTELRPRALPLTLPTELRPLYLPLTLPTELRPLYSSLLGGPGVSPV